jgi:hypothetical protein
MSAGVEVLNSQKSLLAGKYEVGRALEAGGPERSLLPAA